MENPEDSALASCHVDQLDDPAMCLLQRSLLFRTAVLLRKLPLSCRAGGFGNEGLILLREPDTLRDTETVVWSVSQSANASFCREVVYGGFTIS